MSTTPPTVKLLTGALEINEAINGPGIRQTYRMLQLGQLPVRKVGTQYTTTTAALEKFFEPVLGPDRDLSSLLWSGDAIAAHLNTCRRRVNHYRERVPEFPIMRVGYRLVSSPSALAEFFEMNLEAAA